MAATERQRIETNVREIIETGSEITVEARFEADSASRVASSAMTGADFGKLSRQDRQRILPFWHLHRFEAIAR